MVNRYPEYKESGVGWIGEIPSYWQTATIRHLTENLDGRRIPLSGEARTGQNRIYPYYGANGVIDYVEDYIYEGEHILIGEDGAPFFDKTREVSMLASGKFWVNNHCHILKNTCKSEARFIVYCLNSVDYFEYITGSTRDKLTQADLNRIKIPIPTCQEQTQIANFLDRKTGQIDELIHVKERKVELLREQRTALINQAVTKGLDPIVQMKPSGVEWIGEIPKNWDRSRCANLFGVKHIKKTSDEINLSVYRDYGVIKRDSRNDNYNRISEDTSNYKLVEPGDFVFNKMKCWQGSLGISEYRGIVSPAYTVCKPKIPFHGKFFHYLLRSWSYIQEFNRLSYGVRQGQWELRFEDFKDIVVPYPPMQEQTQIADFLDRKMVQIDELKSAEERSIELLKEYRQSLISEVVTGKIDVRNEG